MIALLTVWKLAKSPLGRFLAAVAGALTIAALVMAGLRHMQAEAFANGQKASDARWEARLAVDMAKALAVEARNDQAAQRVGNQVAVAQTEIRWRTKTLIERIPYEVPADPFGWSLPVGFVRHHIEGTSGVAPPADPPGGAVDSPSGVSLAALAEVDDTNAGILAACRVQVAGWQNWWADVSAPISTDAR